MTILSMLALITAYIFIGSAFARSIVNRSETMGINLPVHPSYAYFWLSVLWLPVFVWLLILGFFTVILSDLFPVVKKIEFPKKDRNKG